MLIFVALRSRVSCRVSSPKTRAFGIEWNRTSVKVPRLFDFENLDREKGIVELTRWFYGRSISGEIKVEKSSRVLVFKDQVAKKEPEYLMEIKILSTKMRTREGPDTLGRFCVQIMQEVVAMLLVLFVGMSLTHELVETIHRVQGTQKLQFVSI